MTTHCPDCLFEVPLRKPGKDARCDYCRSQVGHRSRIHNRYAPVRQLHVACADHPTDKRRDDVRW